MVVVGQCWVDLMQTGTDTVGWICSKLGWTQKEEGEREKLIKYCIQSYSKGNHVSSSIIFLDRKKYKFYTF